MSIGEELRLANSSQACTRKSREVYRLSKWARQMLERTSAATKPPQHDRPCRHADQRTRAHKSFACTFMVVMPYHSACNFMTDLHVSATFTTWDTTEQALHNSIIQCSSQANHTTRKSAELNQNTCWPCLYYIEKLPGHLGKLRTIASRCRCSAAGRKARDLNSRCRQEVKHCDNSFSTSAALDVTHDVIRSSVSRVCSSCAVRG